MATTLADVKADLTQLVGDNSTFWVDAEKRDAVNEAVMVWQAMTGQAVGTISLVADGSNFYSTPRQFVSIQRVTFEGVGLSPTSLDELDYGKPGWEGTSGTPDSWAPVGLNLFLVYPAPTSGTILVEGILDGPRMISDSDTLRYAEDTVLPLEHYGHHYLCFKEGGQEFEAAQDDLKAVIQAAGTKNQELLRMALYRRYLGLTKDERARQGAQKVGVRT
jgi:hypothetical protein